MRWLNSKAFGGHRFFLLKQIFLFSVILCFLVAFNLSFADELTDPDSPEWEHPWDDVLDHGGGHNPPGLTQTDADVFTFHLGFKFWIIVHFQPAGQRDGFEEKQGFGPSEKNRGHLLIFIE